MSAYWFEDLPLPDPLVIRYQGKERDVVRLAFWMDQPVKLLARITQFDQDNKLVQYATYRVKNLSSNSSICFFNFTEIGSKKQLRLTESLTGEQYGKIVLLEDVEGKVDITNALGVSVPPPDNIRIKTANVTDGAITREKLAPGVQQGLDVPGIYTGYGPPSLIVGAPVGSIYIDLEGEKTIHKLG